MDPNDPAYKSPWLHALYEKMANIRALGMHCILTDVHGKGEGSLLVVDLDKKLRMFSGTRQTAEVPLIGRPTAICSFNMDESSPRVPGIGVAIHDALYVYRRLRPETRYIIPQDVSTVKEERYITCLGTMPRLDNSTGHGLQGKSCPVIGLESKHVLILDHTAKRELCRFLLPAIPSCIRVIGCFDIDWRLIVACRDYSIYTVTAGDLRENAIIRRPHLKLCAPIVECTSFDKDQLFVATADKIVTCFSLPKLQKKYAIVQQSAQITNLTLLQLGGKRGTILLLALGTGGEIRAYRETQLVDILRIGEPINALLGGVYGREHGSLIIITRSGSLLVKMLPRGAKLQVENRMSIPPEQNVPLPIPKMPKSFLEQINREKNYAPQMYRAYLAEYHKLKIATYKTLLSLVHTGELLEAQTATNSTISIVSTELKGLGPRFHMLISLVAKKEPAIGLPVVIEYDLDHFRCQNPYQVAPVLVPGRVTQLLFILDEIRPHDTTPLASPEQTTILVLSPDPAATTPLLVTTLSMAPRTQESLEYTDVCLKKHTSLLPPETKLKDLQAAAPDLSLVTTKNSSRKS